MSQMFVAALTHASTLRSPEPATHPTPWLAEMVMERQTLLRGKINDAYVCVLRMEQMIDELLQLQAQAGWQKRGRLACHGVPDKASVRSIALG